MLYSDEKGPGKLHSDGKSPGNSYGKALEIRMERNPMNWKAVTINKSENLSTIT